MSDNSDSYDLKLKPFDWAFYLHPFLKESIVTPIQSQLDSKEQSHNEGLFLLISHTESKSPTSKLKLPFGTSKQDMQIIIQNQIELAKTEPLCAHFTANRYVREQNIPKSLYFCLFASLAVPLYQQNYSNILAPLQKFYSNNKQSILSLFELFADEKITSTEKTIIISFLHFKFEQDLIIQIKLFQELVQLLLTIDDENEHSLLAFEMLLGLNFSENNKGKDILEYLCKSVNTQRKLILKLKQQYDILFHVLSEDHELFQAFRHKLKNLIVIREFVWQKQKDQEMQKQEQLHTKVINSEIDIILLKVLRGLNENSSNLINDNERFELTYMYSKILKYMAKQEHQDQWQHLKLVKILELHCSTKVSKLQLNFVNSCILKLKTISFKIRTKKIHDELKLELKNLEISIADYINNIHVDSFQSLNEKFACLLILRKPNSLLSKLFNPEFNTSLPPPSSNINFSFALTPSTQSQFTFASNQFDNQSVALSDHTDSNIQAAYEKVVQNQALRAQYFFEEYSYELNKFHHFLAYYKIGQKFGYQNKQLTHNFFSVNYIRKSQLFNLDLATITHQLKQYNSNQIILTKLLKKETFYDSHIAEIRAQGKEEKVPCFVKIYKCNLEQRNMLLENIVQHKNQSNVNPVLGYFSSPSEFAIISHLRYNCLAEMIKKPFISLCKIIDTIRQLSLTMLHWHSNGQLMGNLKCSNIFNESGIIYITDFWIPNIQCSKIGGQHGEFDLDENEFVVGFQQMSCQHDYNMFAQIITELLFAFKQKLFTQDQMNLASLGWLKKEGFSTIYKVLQMLLSANGKQIFNQVCKEINTWTLQ